MFHYDHIEDFARVQEHRVENLALLCPNHHQDKSSGRLSKETVRCARERPFNSGQMMTAKHELPPARAVEAHLGSNIAYDPGETPDYDVLWINGRGFVVLHHEERGYTYSATVTDEAGQVLLAIDHGALRAATGIWDYQYEGSKVTVRRGPGDILLEAEVTDRVFRVNRGSFVDEFETGAIVTASGDLVFTMSGLQVGRIAQGTIGRNGQGALAVVRGSCFDEHNVPGGFGFVRGWAASYEAQAEHLRQQALAGVPGPRPIGLENFRPFPRH
jgi:hypothetical protein